MIKATVGGVVDVRLPSTPTTGYRWHLEGPPDGLETVEDNFTSTSEKLGAGGNHSFRLRATKPGSYKLNFALKRSWESHATEHHAVDVEVE